MYPANPGHCLSFRFEDTANIILVCSSLRLFIEKARPKGAEEEGAPEKSFGGAESES